MAGIVRQRQQEGVVIVVVRAEGPVGLLHQRSEVAELLVAEREVPGTVGDDVQMHRHPGAGVEIDASEVFAGDQRRVDQVIERHRPEGDRAAGGAGRVERGAVLPARRQGHAGRDGIAARVVAGRIHHHLVPFEIDQPRCRGHTLPEFAAAGRREELEGDIQARDARRHLEVHGVHVPEIAAPGDALAVAADHQSDNVLQRAAGRVLAGNPLGVVQGHRSRPRHRDRLVHAEDLARRVTQIDRQRQRARIGRSRQPREVAGGAGIGLGQGGCGNGQQRGGETAGERMDFHDNLLG